MAGASISIRLDGSKQLSQQLHVTMRSLESPIDLFTEIGDALVVSTQHRFETSRRPEGAFWPMSIRALFEGGKTLRDSGRLANSITREASERGVRVGTNVIYAAVHQFGATIRPKKGDRLFFKVQGKKVAAKQVRIPARPFLGISKADEAEIATISNDYMRMMLGGRNA